MAIGWPSSPVVSQQLSPASDQVNLDSSVVLKRVSTPKFAGNKKHYEAWKLLRLRECLQGEALKVVENLDALVVNLTDAKQEAELGSRSLYITLQCKFNKNLLAKYKQWISDNGKSESVNARVR